MTDAELCNLILDLDTRRRQATLAGNVDDVENFIGSSLCYVHASGSQEDRSLYLQRQRDGYYQYKAMEPTRQECRIFGDTVLVHGDMRINVIVNGVEKDFTGRYLQVWSNENDNWKMVAWQTTRLP